MNGAESLVHSLLKSGVTTCFSNPGTSEMHFVAALDRVPGMHCVLGLFEGVVTGAADGYARMAGKPAATLLHCGPGLANGLANLHNARRAATPIVNIVGDQATYHRPLDSPLTADTEGFARGVSGWVRTSMDVRTVGADAAAAVQASMMAPGQVATLILPSDTSWNDGGIVAEALPVLPTAVSVAKPDRRSGGCPAPRRRRHRAAAGRGRPAPGRSRARSPHPGRHRVPHRRARLQRPHGARPGPPVGRPRALCRRCRRQGDGRDKTAHPRRLAQAGDLLRLSQQGADLDPRRRRDPYPCPAGTGYRGSARPPCRCARLPQGRTAGQWRPAAKPDAVR